MDRLRNAASWSWGAHYDSVADTQAAGDNGTGVVSVLLMAEEIADAHYEDDIPLPYDVRLIFFGVEEIGLYGSRHYVDELSEEERQEIIAMLNFDAMGKGDASVEGSAELANLASELAAENQHSIEEETRSEKMDSGATTRPSSERTYPRCSSMATTSPS